MKIREYLSTVFGGVAKGLFASLIIGVVIEQIGSMLNIEFIKNIGIMAKYFMGPCIGFGVAYSRNSKQLTMLAAGVVGAIGAGTIIITQGVVSFQFGDPAGAMFATMVAIEVGNRLEDKTGLDILLVPAAVILVGGILGYFISPWITYALTQLGFFINELTKLQPAIMGILIGITVGALLTGPVSSAAICIAINISGLAAGAALAGCCAQMIGFAFSSYRENKVPGLLIMGIGTAKLQMPNIIKNPLIWIPPTIASGVCGFLAANVFMLSSDSVGAGMGNCGFVGPLRTYNLMGNASILPMILNYFIIPAIISLAISEIMRKYNWIKFGDMKLS